MAACRLAVAVEAPCLGGTTPLVSTARAFVTATLKDHNLVLGLENHREKPPQELLDEIGADGQGVIRAALDTGSFATLGYDATQAATELAGHLVHVHLRDVLAPGSDESCRYGRGCVPLERCVRTLQELGYTGPISFEHNPASYDPTEDCRASLALLRGWLSR